MSDNVKVSIKVRPLIKRERDSKLTSQWRIRDNTIASIDGNGDPFVFDHIFDETVSTRQLFDTVCRPVILSALNGINGTIFAYGQTSSGKTYTMIGNGQEPGVVPLTAREIFEQIKKIKERQFLIRVGFIEIYNEKIHDLLNTANTNLKIVENQCGDVSVNSKECITNCAEQIIQHVDDGNKARKIGETNMNERSSRSHTIFRITIESRTINPTSGEGGMDNEAVQIGILNLVDLAGSERADQTGATGSRFKEGVCINKSLLSLSCVIQKLSENSDKQFINYRDSKLTRILQASLGGNAVTSMICNITPAVVDETYYTLSFAMRAKNIRNKPKVNEILTDAAMMKRLEREIKRLQNELRSEQNKNSKIKTMELQNAITLRTNQFINSNQAQLSLTDNARRRTWCPSTTEIPRLAAAHHRPTELMGEGRTLMGPPAAVNGGQYLVTMNGATPQIAIRSADDDHHMTSSNGGGTGDGFAATLALIGEDERHIQYRELLDHQDLLARRGRSPNGSLNPFASYGDEFVPGEQISFGPASLSPLSAMEREIHTPKSLRRTRRSSTGDSPPQFDYEQRCRVLEQELLELQEFTKLENSLETQHLKKELSDRTAELTDLKHDLEEKEQRLEQLEERCTHLEIELKSQMAAVTKAEHDLALAAKERQAAVRDAELHRNQLTGVEFEYERFRQRSEAREKELIESLQEARSGGGGGGGGGSGNASNGTDSFRLDQKREEMKRLEMQNYEFTLQLEECNKQIEQLKASCLDQHRKLETVKQFVLQHPQTTPSDDGAVAQTLINSLRKLLMSQDMTVPEDVVNGSQKNGPDTAAIADRTTNGIDWNATILGEEKTIQELVKIVEQLEENIQTLEEEKRSLQEANDAQLGQMKAKLESKYASIEQLEKEIGQWKAKFATQTTEYDELSTQLMDQMQDNEDLRKEFDELKQSMAELEKGNEAKRAELERDMVTLRETLEKATNERDSLREAIGSLQAALKESNSQVETIVEEKEKVSLARDEAKLLLEEATTKRDETLKELESVKTMLEDTILKRDEMIKELEHLRGQKLTDVNDELGKLKAEIVRLETSIVEQRSEKELLITENENLSSLLDKLRAEYQKACIESEQKQQEYMQQLQQFKVEADCRTAELDAKLESSESGHNERLEKLQVEKEGLFTSNNELQLRIDELQAAMQQLKDDKNNLINLEQTRTEKESAMQEELTVLRQCQVSQEAHVKQLEQKLSEYEREIASLTDREGNQAVSYESITKQLQDELAQLMEVKDSLATKEANVREELGKAAEVNAELSKRIETLEQELQSSRSEQSQIVEKLIAEQQKYEDCRKDIEQQLETAHSTLVKLREENSELVKRQYGDREEQAKFVQELTRCKETLEQQLAEKEKELEQQLAEKEKELATITSSLETVQEKCNAMAQEQKTEHESYNCTRQKLEEEIELLKKMVDQLSEDKSTVEKEHADCSARQQSLQSALEEREVEILRYITDLDALRAEQIRLVEEQNEAKRELEQKNGNLQRELDVLQENVLQLMGENEALLKEQLEGAKNQQERFIADAEELLKLRSCRDESERLVSQLERDLATVRAELEMVRTELLEEKRRRDEIQQTEQERSQSMNEELERLRCAIIALEAEKQRLAEAEGRLREEAEAKERRIAELEALQQERETVAEELRKENNDLTIAVQELSAKIVSLEEQVDSNEASQRKTIDTLIQERQEQDDAIAALKQQLSVADGKLQELEKQRSQVQQELREVKSSLEESLAARLRLEQDIEESSSVRDVLERELRDLKSDLESLDNKLANERYEQECQVSADLRRALEEKKKELESFMATGRPSLGDGRVVQALRRENEDLLKQLNEARQIDGLKARQLQERVDELERLEREIAKLRDEMGTMRHESSFNEKVEEITNLQQKVQDAEKVREETVHQKRTLERAFDQLRFKHQSLAKEVDELRRTTDKERRNRRQSTHDDRRGLLFNSKEVATMTDPTTADCACAEMNEKIKELRNKLTLKDCQLNTQKLISSANPLKNEITEMRRKLEEQNREKSQIDQELREVLEQLDKERKDRKRHCTQCMRHSRQQNARCDKAVQAYQLNDSSSSSSSNPSTAVSVSIVSTSRAASIATGDGGAAELVALQKRCDEQHEQYERLNEKYQTMKQLCRIRNEKISSLSAGLAEKENENTNVSRSIQNECIQLRQQLKEAENRYAQIYHLQMKGKSLNKSDIGLQTDSDGTREEAEMYRVKYERYKALAARLIDEAKASKMNGQRTAGLVAIILLV
uniref:Kinesin motor domain-containing protein n=1 Tax=Anopheles epiroticus TaxID=199890 RepID=A0A182PPG6_9DIPT